MVLSKELERQHKEAKREQQGLPQQTNSLSGQSAGPGSMSGETITYVNENA